MVLIHRLAAAGSRASKCQRGPARGATKMAREERATEFGHARYAVVDDALSRDFPLSTNLLDPQVAREFGIVAAYLLDEELGPRSKSGD